jgi:hypothetical protein
MSTPDPPFYVYRIMREVGSDVWSPIYVGKGKNGRAFEHEKVAKRIAALPPEERRAAVRRCSNKRLIRTLIKHGGSLPVEFVSTGLTEAEAFALEVETIRRYGRSPRSGEYGLINRTDGGEGVSGMVHRDEFRAVHSVAMSGDNNPMKRPDVRAVHSVAMTNPEARAKISAAQKAQWANPEYRAAMSGDNNPMKRPDVRAKVSGDNSPMKRPEVRAKQSAMAKIQWASPGVRAKISAAQKAAWARRHAKDGEE